MAVLLSSLIFSLAFLFRAPLRAKSSCQHAFKRAIVPLLLLVPSSLHADSAAPEPKRYVVVLKTAIEPSASLVTNCVKARKDKTSCTAKKRTPRAELNRCGLSYETALNSRDFILASPSSELKISQKKIKRCPQVAFFEEDIAFESTADDTLYSSQWSMGNSVASINAEAGWTHYQSSATTSEVVLAIFDTGIKYDHEDLAHNMWRNAREVPNNNRDDDGNGVIDDVYGASFRNGVVSGISADAHGHGTHVAGIAAAVTNNSRGVAGVAGKLGKVKVLSVKVLESGLGNLSDLVAGLNYVMNLKRHYGVNITTLNFSLVSSGSFAPQSLKHLLQQAGAQKIFAVASAGNGSVDLDLPQNNLVPAAYDLENLITVAALDIDGNLYQHSNFGRRKVHVAAPGVSILSTYLGNQPNNKYAHLSGTSMAAPHVAAVAAMITSMRPDLLPRDIRLILSTSGKPLSSIRYLTASGSTLDLAKAINFAQLTRYASISGVVSPAQSGIRIDAGLLGSTETDLYGRYEFRNIVAGTSYQLRPQKEGYTFQPGEKTGIIWDNLVINFNAQEIPRRPVSGRITININGQTEVPVPNVLVTFEGKGSTYTDSDGRYVFQAVQEGTSFTMRPSLAHLSFSPAAVTATVGTSGYVQNFSATSSIEIAGRVIENSQGLGNVAVSGSIQYGGPNLGSVLSNSQGYYRFYNLLPGWWYSIEARKTGYTFSPATYSGQLSQSMTNNFTATRIPGPFFRIAGSVYSSGGNPIQGIRIRGFALGDRITDSSGYFEFSQVQQGTNFRVEPSDARYNFNPTAYQGTLNSNVGYTFVASPVPPPSPTVSFNAPAAYVSVANTTVFTCGGTGYTSMRLTYGVIQLGFVQSSAPTVSFSVDTRTIPNGLRTLVCTATNATGTSAAVSRTFNFENSTTHTVSGHIRTSSGAPIPNVDVDGGVLGIRTTNSAGFYSFTFETGMHVVLIPCHQQYTFNPIDFRRSHVTSNLTANFTGTMISPWRNPSNAADVNFNGIVQPQDANLILNYIAANGPGPLPNTRPPGSPYYDADGDWDIDSNDAQYVIDRIPSGCNGAWQNPNNRFDVNNRDGVTPVDALLISNRLNTVGPGPVPSHAPRGAAYNEYYFDVNGDCRIDNIDHDQVIGALG